MTAANPSHSQKLVWAFDLFLVNQITRTSFQKNVLSMVECIFGMQETLGSIPTTITTTKIDNKEKKILLSRRKSGSLFWFCTALNKE